MDTPPHTNTNPSPPRSNSDEQGQAKVPRDAKCLLLPSTAVDGERALSILAAVAAATATEGAGPVTTTSTTSAKITSPTPPTALFVPEICLAILAQLVSEYNGKVDREGRRALAAASRVCRSWFPLAVALLWRAPPAAALRHAAAHAAAPSERIPVYAAAVRALTVDTPLLLPPAPDAVANAQWRFAGARALRFGVAPSRDRVAALREALGRCGPLLTSVEVGAPNDWLACRAAVSAATAALRQQHCVDLAALVLVAQHRGLQRFVSHAHVPGAALQLCLRDAHQPFRSLTELCVPVEVADVPQLAALATAVAKATLAVLHVRVAWSGRLPVRSCAAFAGLAGLKDLCVEWEECESVDVNDFMGLATLAAGLRRLRLVTGCSELASPEHPCLADEHLLAVVARLLHLEELVMDVFGTFTGVVLRVIGERCRRLTKLNLRLPCDLAALEGSTAPNLFPRLSVLGRRVVCVNNYLRYLRLTQLC